VHGLFQRLLPPHETLRFRDLLQELGHSDAKVERASLDTGMIEACCGTPHRLCRWRYSPSSFPSKRKTTPVGFLNLVWPLLFVS
jgi:hypothetical protein